MFGSFNSRNRVTMAEEEQEPLLSSRNSGKSTSSCSSSTDMMLGRKPLVDLLAVVFGLGAWVSVNGLWVELPLLVADLPEGWNLPSYLSVIIQIANVGPIAYSLLRSFYPDQRPAPVVYGVLAMGCAASLLLSLFWQKTSWVFGANHSTALLTFVFLLSLVDCTSSVLFMPYMAVWREMYLPSYLVGEGLSGLLPALVSLAQGVGGNAKCENVTKWNVTDEGNISYVVQEPMPLHPRFSVTSFFYILFAMMIASTIAFTLLENLPNIKSERSISPTESVATLDASQTNTQLMGNAVFPKQGMTSLAYWLMLAGQAWACCLTNGALPSIQSYSCGAYGNIAYHLAVALSSLANPLAALLTLVLPRARAWLLVVLGAFGTLISCYIFATAALSPRPPLMGTPGGEALVVLAWILFTGVMTYVRVEIANQMREESARALFWCGAVTQAGSAVGAITTFVLINVYNLFTPYYPC